MDQGEFQKVECPELVEGQHAVYLLQCNDKSFYSGFTNNLKRRLIYHNSKNGSMWTAKRIPAQLVWYQVFTSNKEAAQNERKIKGWSRVKKIKLITGDWSL